VSDKEKKEPQNERVVVEIEKQTPYTPPPYKLKISFPQGLSNQNWMSKLKKFDEMLKSSTLISLSRMLFLKCKHMQKFERDFINKKKR
jgi:hypothetical protein